MAPSWTMSVLSMMLIAHVQDDSHDNLDGIGGGDLITRCRLTQSCQ